MTDLSQITSTADGSGISIDVNVGGITAAQLDAAVRGTWTFRAALWIDGDVDLNTFNGNDRHWRRFLRQVQAAR